MGDCALSPRASAQMRKFEVERVQFEGRVSELRKTLAQKDVEMDETQSRLKAGRRAQNEVAESSMVVRMYRRASADVRVWCTTGQRRAIAGREAADASKHGLLTHMPCSANSARRDRSTSCAVRLHTQHPHFPTVVCVWPRLCLFVMTGQSYGPPRSNARSTTRDFTPVAT